MNAQIFAIVFAVIAALLLILNLGYRKQREEDDEPITEVKLPSGLTLTNEEILSLSINKLNTCDHRDLQVLVDYIGHRMVEAEAVGDDELHDRWGKLFELASGALYGYL